MPASRGSGRRRGGAATRPPPLPPCKGRRRSRMLRHVSTGCAPAGRPPSANPARPCRPRNTAGRETAGRGRSSSSACQYTSCSTPRESWPPMSYASDGPDAIIAGGETAVLGYRKERNMTYLGHVSNGVVVLDGSVTLPDGLGVKVEPMESSQDEPAEEGDSDPIREARAVHREGRRTCRRMRR